MTVNDIVTITKMVYEKYTELESKIGRENAANVSLELLKVELKNVKDNS